MSVPSELPWESQESEPYRHVVDELQRAAVALSTTAASAHPAAPLAVPELEALGCAVTAIAEHVASTRLAHFAVAPTTGKVTRQMLDQTASTLGHAGVLIGRLVNLQACQQPLPVAQLKEDQAMQAELKTETDPWERLARSTRASLLAIGWRYPMCFPGEAEECGQNYEEHAAANLALTRAINEHFTAQMSPQMHPLMSATWRGATAKLAEEGTPKEMGHDTKEEVGE